MKEILHSILAEEFVVKTVNSYIPSRISYKFVLPEMSHPYFTCLHHSVHKTLANVFLQCLAIYFFFIFIS